METGICEYCDVTYPLMREGDFYDGHTGEGTITVAWVTDPFNEEIHDDDTKHWLCSSCVYDSLIEI